MSVQVDCNFDKKKPVASHKCIGEAQVFFFFEDASVYTSPMGTVTLTQSAAELKNASFFRVQKYKKRCSPRLTLRLFEHSSTLGHFFLQNAPKHQLESEREYCFVLPNKTNLKTDLQLNVLWQKDIFGLESHSISTNT